jgi:hypothetical protein
MILYPHNIERMPKNKYVGKIVFVNLPGVSRPRMRWVVRINENGKYVLRAPKVGVMIRDLQMHRDGDFGPETVLPKGATFFQSKGKSKRGMSKKGFSNKTKKNR